MKTRSLSLLVLMLLGASFYSIAQRPADGSSPFASHSPFDSGAHEKTNVSGSVQDMHNVPLKDIRVQLVDTGGLITAQGYTTATGNFEFSSVTPGLYSVVATAG